MTMLGIPQGTQAGAILCDPPYRFATRSAKARGRSPSMHYEDLTPEEIISLPVRECAGADCWLFLWLPHPHIGLLEPIMAAGASRYRPSLHLGKDHEERLSDILVGAGGARGLEPVASRARPHGTGKLGGLFAWSTGESSSPRQARA